MKYPQRGCIQAGLNLSFTSSPNFPKNFIRHCREEGKKSSMSSKCSNYTFFDFSSVSDIRLHIFHLSALVPCAAAVKAWWSVKGLRTKVIAGRQKTPAPPLPQVAECALATRVRKLTSSGQCRCDAAATPSAYTTGDCRGGKVRRTLYGVGLYTLLICSELIVR